MQFPNLKTTMFNFVRQSFPKSVLILLNKFFYFSPSPPGKLYSHTEKQRYDGWFNNLAHPDWGSVGKCHKSELKIIIFILIKTLN